ncbi:hypothetical protein [Nonlabens ponticola]|uniref:Uncharacterized protein n=1 Tax=Nonlabens ponticola TaxID=2496866 RepID=A0A3S9N046_9FLAO|nr:hypothetical protein [Nonlabens ponticola]AZQ44758.1 hypothetical protein EJ995_11130 [Nonlabens ponticola]
MSTAGHIRAMITVMKNNARRRKTSDKSMAGAEAGSLYKSGSKAPTFTKKQIADTKKAIREKAQKEQRRRLQLLTVVIIATPILCYAIYKLLEYLIF